MPRATTEEKTTNTNEETKQDSRREEFRLSGEDVVAKIKELIHEGNVRRIIIKSEKGNTILEVPLTVGVVGVALLPVYAAIGALAALLTKCTIVVERKSE